MIVGKHRSKISGSPLGIFRALCREVAKSSTKNCRKILEGLQNKLCEKRSTVSLSMETFHGKGDEEQEELEAVEEQEDNN